MTFHSIPHSPKSVKATQAQLDAIYHASKKGLRGDNLALAANIQPSDYNRLIQFDQDAELAELKGRADTELELSNALHEAALGGDAKSALEILKHQHGWVAKQQINIDVDQRISITQALEQANMRVLEIVDAPYTVITDETQQDTDSANDAV
jgi:hypothetical protein